VLAGTLFLVVLAWTNLTGFGLGTQPLTYDDVALPRFAVTLVGAALVWLILAAMLAKGGRLAWDPTWALLGALAAWSVASAALANTTLVWLGQSERLEGVATVFLYAILFGAGLQHGRSKRFVRRFSIAFVLGAVLLALLGITQLLKLDHTNYTIAGTSFYMGSAFASLGNPNFLAGVLVLALPITVGLALTEHYNVARIIWWAGAATITVALYATYSQGSWLAAVLELALGVGFWLWIRQTKTRGGETVSKRSGWRVWIVSLLVVVVGVAIIITAMQIATSRGLRLWGASLSETTSGRVLLAQTSLNAVARRPLFGFGPDNYLAAFRLYRPARYLQVFGPASTNNNAHSWILQYATTLGIPGALLLAAALLFGLVRSRPRPGPGDDSPNVLAAAIWIGAVGYCVQMMFNAAMLASTVPFWVLLGAISAPYARRIVVVRTAAIVGVAAGALLVVGAVVGSGFLLAADASFVDSRLAYNNYTTADHLALAERAAALDPLSVKYARAVAQSRSVPVLAAISSGTASDSEVRALYASAMASFDHALSLSPDDYAALSWLAGLQSVTGSYLRDSAIRAAAHDTARKAAAVDVTHSSVALLLKGDTSNNAVKDALAEPGLP
jgi:hypothetical protein